MERPAATTLVTSQVTHMRQCVSITDTTGANFPAYYPRWTPPAIDAVNTPWNASIAWQNGAQHSGTITVSNGNCTTKGAPLPTTHAPYFVSPVVYTVTCSGIDSNANLASKVHIYGVYFETGRGGGFWQPPQDGTGTTTFTAIGAPPAKAR
jgi:hypothetical protein